MDKPVFLAIVLTILLWVTILTGLFNYNMPNWCAHPDRPGNHLIQPLCK